MDTRIDKTTTLKGKLETQDPLVVEGTIEGEIKSKGLLTVAQGGRVLGDIDGIEVVVGGLVQGNVTAAGQLVLQSTGKIEGDVRAGHLTVEDGGVLSGKVMTEGAVPKSHVGS